MVASSKAGTDSRYNRVELETLAAAFREENARAAGSLAAMAPGDLSRQPQLDIESFKVNGAQAAVSPDCSYRLFTTALKAPQISADSEDLLRHSPCAW